MQLETMALHAGYKGDPTTHAAAVPIYQTLSYEFDSSAHAAALFNLETDGYRYSRIGNPTVDVLEQRLAALEGGVGAVCVSSGQAALHHVLLTLAGPGRNIISVPQLYGTSHTLFTHVLPQLGMSVRFTSPETPEAIDALVDDNTMAVFCESIGNPAGNICDLEPLAQAAHRHGIPLIVDNTVATPVLLRPFEFGADIVIHSLSKFLGGHGTTLGGAIIDSGLFPWHEYPHRFPMLNEPDPSYHGLRYVDHFGTRAFIGRCRNFALRTTGSSLSALSAFLLLQGVETVALRMERHVANASQVAEFLRGDPRIAWVNYAGLPNNPHYQRAQKYLGGRAGSLLTLGLQGNVLEAEKFYDSLLLIKRLVNLGDAKSLACHPASTTHRQMSLEEQLQAGVSPEMIRLSIGIEHIDDIIGDLDQALTTSGITSARRSPALAI